ncbi:hypothetical protein [Methanoculleus chikugoensis]|nr:hypothetical protein [Methanoculleus chikugoensis]
MIIDFKLSPAYENSGVLGLEGHVSTLAVCMENESLLFENYGRYSQ